MMEHRYTAIFLAIEALLFAGPFVMPGIVPLWTPWVAVALAVALIAYAVFPRRFVPSWFGRESGVGMAEKPEKERPVFGLGKAGK